MILFHIPSPLLRQALDGDFSEENRNSCRVATAPLIEAVENLTVFASNPEFASVPAQISREVAPRGPLWDTRTPVPFWFHSCPPGPLGRRSSGAHPPVCLLHARQLHPPAEDGTLAGHQPQRPAHVVGSGRPFSHRVRLHQGPDHSHPVGES